MVQKGILVYPMIRMELWTWLANRACHKSKISLNFFGTRIFSWECMYINGKFWFWQIFFIFKWVKMPPKGYDEKNVKNLFLYGILFYSKSLPYESAFIFTQKCIGTKI